MSRDFIPQLTFENCIEPNRCRLGLIVAYGVDSTTYPAGFDALLDGIVARRRQPLTPEEDSLREAVRRLLRNGKYRPTGRGKPASEYLVRSARDIEGGFPRINSLVDCCNLVSLENLVPISLWDLDLAAADRFRFRTGAPGDAYIFNQGGQTIDLEDLVVGCRVIDGAVEPIVTPVKDSLLTKTVAGTQNIGAAVYAPADAFSAEQLGVVVETFRVLLAACGTSVITRTLLLEPDTSGKA